MKKLLIAALFASAAISAPAMAQSTVTGTVNITGSVANKCLVLPGAGSTFGATVAYGELAQADGTMRTDLATTFTAASGSLSARVVCTTANPTISVDATPLATAAPAAAGYDNSIDFQADVAVTTVVSTTTYSNDTANAALAATALDGRLANNGSNNIVISASNFRTNSPGNTDLLVADPSYTGSISVVIAPGA